MTSRSPLTIRMTVNDKAISARMIDSLTARDFAALLPMTSEAIPEPGVIVLGRVTAGVIALDVQGPVTVQFQLPGQDRAEYPQSNSQNLSGPKP